MVGAWNKTSTKSSLNAVDSMGRVVTIGAGIPLITISPLFLPLFQGNADMNGYMTRSLLQFLQSSSFIHLKFFLAEKFL